MRLNDLVLFFVIFGSMVAALYLPDFGKPFGPFLTYFLMLLLFLSFLGMDFAALVDTSHQALFQLCFLVSIKLIVLPSVLLWTAVAIIPDYAVPILLLSGISTGVVAPFIATLIAAMYMFPFYAMIVPVNIFADRLRTAACRT